MGYRDETYNKAVEFIDNFKNIHQGVSNVYVFTTTDREGNITDQKYSMNLLTNYGFKTLFSTESTAFAASDSVKLYVGSGVSDIHVTGQSIEIPLFTGLAATNENVNKAYGYPMYYSPGIEDGTGLITLISRFLICSYPYDISNVPGDVAISEYGIGTGYNNLWTHSHIYDMTGRKTTIIKHPNEKLTITVYMCLSLYEHVIQRGWSKTYNAHNAKDFDNNFTCITKNAIMYNHMFESSVDTFKRYQKKTRGESRSHTIDTAIDNNYTVSTILGAFDIYDGGGEDAGYIDGFVRWYDGFHIMEMQFLDEPENVVLNQFRSNDPYVYSGFSQKFGLNPSSWDKTQYPSITTLFDAEVNLYNYHANDWTNKMDIYNPDDKWYTEREFSDWAQPIYYSNNGEILTGYVFQNLRPDDKIIRVDKSVLTLYVTDKYWDYSSWTWINDFNNIPPECQSAKYWITNSSSGISVHRKSDVFYLCNKGTQSHGFKDLTYAKKYGFTLQCNNFEHKWYMSNEMIRCPDNMLEFTIGNTGVDSTFSMTWGKWLVTLNSMVNSYYMTDTSGIKLSLPPDPVKETVDFGVDVNLLTQTYKTESNTGLICLQATNTNKAVVIKMTGSSYSHTVFDWKMSCCIWGTNKIAFVDPETNMINIFDTDTQSLDGAPIELPAGSAAITIMVGHSSYIWFSDGASYSYRVNINTSDREVVGVDTRLTYNGNIPNVRITSVEDCLIIYNYKDNNVGNATCIELSTLRVFKLTKLQVSDNSDVGAYISFDLVYIQNDTLVLVLTRPYHHSSSLNNGADNRVYDFGQFLNSDTVQMYRYIGDARWNFHVYGTNIIHGNTSICPIVNFLPIKLTGKTNTITALNNIKHLSKKQWLLSFTNTPMWGYEISGSGNPPGTPVPVTNKTGEITVWT